MVGEKARICVLVLLALGSLQAKAFCTWKVDVLDLGTGEVREFQPGAKPVDLPIGKLKGWAGCKMTAAREYKDPVQGTVKRFEIFCTTASGEVSSMSPSVSTHRRASLDEMSIYAAPLIVGPPAKDSKDGAPALSTPGGRSLVATCL